tara:strand:+ start:101 stop:346 length:246 start_codon:yes stop_codon:yes gene_type:complete
MKKFWPQRCNPKGFSIQNLARKYRLKISSLSNPTNELSNQVFDKNNIIFTKEGGEKIPITNISIKGMHWANRDFSEYKEAA